MSKRFCRFVRVLTVFLILIWILPGCTRSSKQNIGEGASSDPPVEDTQVIILNWENYLGDDVVTAFEEETGIDVVEIFYLNEEEMLGAVQSGPEDYDLVVASDDAVREMRQAKMLAVLDFTKIPNFRFIDQKFQRQGWDPEQKYSVPYLWGTLGLVVNTKYVPDSVDSWSVLFDKAFAGRIGLLDDPWEVIVPAAKYLGYSINTQSIPELESISSLLKEQEPLVKGYYDGETLSEFLIDESVWLGLHYSGDALYAAEENENISYLVPKEGSVQYVDLLVIPRKAKHVNAAHLLIDFILEPEINAGIAETYWYATPNAEAEKLLDPEILESEIVFPSDDVLLKCEYFDSLGNNDRIISETWATLMQER